MLVTKTAESSPISQSQHISSPTSPTVTNIDVTAVNASPIPNDKSKTTKDSNVDTEGHDIKKVTFESPLTTGNVIEHKIEAEGFDDINLENSRYVH